MTLSNLDFKKVGVGPVTGYSVTGDSETRKLIISNCNFYKTENRAIYLSSSQNTIITDNIFYGSGTFDNYDVTLSIAKNTTFSSNHFLQSALHYPKYGIYESGTADYTKILEDNVFSVSNPVTLLGSNSWALFVNGSTAKIGVQNKTGTYWN
jgi:parallel beta-helix repeat protein